MTSDKRRTFSMMGMMDSMMSKVCSDGIICLSFSSVLSSSSNLPSFRLHLKDGPDEEQGGVPPCVHISNDLLEFDLLCSTTENKKIS